VSRSAQSIVRQLGTLGSRRSNAHVDSFEIDLRAMLVRIDADGAAHAIALAKVAPVFDGGASGP